MTEARLDARHKEGWYKEKSSVVVVVNTSNTLVARERERKRESLSEA